MVRLRDLPEYERDHLLSKCDPPLGPPVWVAPKRAAEALRMALLTTAGLHYRDVEALRQRTAPFGRSMGRTRPGS